MAEMAVRVKSMRATYVGRASRLKNFNNNSNANANDHNVNNSNALRGIAQNDAEAFPLISYRDLWSELCSYYNLELAYCKARKHKTLKCYVVEFEKNLGQNLLQLHH